MAQHAGDLDATRRTLSQLDLTEVEQLSAELARLEELIRVHDLEIDAAKKTVTLAEQRIVAAEGTIKRINEGRDARFQERETRFAA